MNGATDSRVNGATTNRAERRERWRGLVTEQRSSGESKRAFCRGRGVSYPRFLAWAKRLAPKAEGAGSGRLAVAERRRSADAFCEVRVGAPVFEIASGDVVVRVSSGFDAGELARLLRAVFEAARPAADVSRFTADATRTAVEATRPC